MVNAESTLPLAKCTQNKRVINSQLHNSNYSNGLPDPVETEFGKQTLNFEDTDSKNVLVHTVIRG